MKERESVMTGWKLLLHSQGPWTNEKIRVDKKGKSQNFNTCFIKFKHLFINLSMNCQFTTFENKSIKLKHLVIAEALRERERETERDSKPAIFIGDG